LDPACGPPQGWGYYTTEAGDSLPSLAEEFEIDLEALLRANCFLDPSDFEPGLRIYAPDAAQEP
jgi:LysM repeat protein